VTNDQPLAVEAASVGIPTIAQHQLFRHNFPKVLSELAVCCKAVRLTGCSKATRALAFPLFMHTFSEVLSEAQLSCTPSTPSQNFSRLSVVKSLGPDVLRICVSSVHAYQDAPSETSASYEEKQRQKQDSVRELEASLSQLSLERKENKADRRKKAEQVVQRRLADVCGKEAHASALLPHTSTLSVPLDTHYASTSISACCAADAGTGGTGGGGISPAPQAQALTNFPLPWVPVTLPCGLCYWWNKETNETTDVGAAQPTTMYHRPHMAPQPAAILPPPSHPPPSTADAYLKGPYMATQPAAILPPPSHPPPTTADAYLKGPYMATQPAALLPPPSHPPPTTADAYLPAPTHPAPGHSREAAFQKLPQDLDLAHVLLPRTYNLN
jgi:hypothetical protein